ncbi:hypothetical protein I7I51_08283 [Histoplasma capsulatum]|uniref:Uncharacterized protein n=1 Tax=Ajellomyces capsulatus TaxID=5037 RepID=A0A8A1M2F7_AJECA|nr:hypothetical protein I7I51_08283 [Histoplasma capsulatum]
MALPRRQLFSVCNRQLPTLVQTHRLASLLHWGLALSGRRQRQYPHPRSNGNVENTPTFRGRPGLNTQGSYGDGLSTESSRTVLPVLGGVTRSENSSPRKENHRAGSTSPLGCRREITVATPKSST